MNNARRGFSLIEVVFVLVILGIVASIGSSILVQVYENYIVQRAVYNVSNKTELAATQIVNRLNHRIQGTIISKDHEKFLNHYLHGGALDINDSLALDEIPAGGTKYTTIEWIGYDNDSFDAKATPAWSGVGDYTTATRNQFSSPGSDLTTAATIMNNLSATKVDLTANKPAAVLFYQKNNYYRASTEYDFSCMGLLPSSLGGTTDCIFPVAQNGSTGFNFVTTTAHPAIVPKIVTERYKLAWSAYALAPELNDKGQYDLILYSNYQPWNGENYIQDGRKSTLIKNISVFRFSESAGVIQFKLCALEPISKDLNISNCKEKAVIR